MRKIIGVNFIFGKTSFNCYEAGCPASRIWDVGNTQQLRRLVFKLPALDDKIFFRILARLELEVQVAQIFVELFLALQQIVQPRLLALRGEDVLRPEGVDEEHKQQQHSGN